MSVLILITLTACGAVTEEATIPVSASASPVTETPPATLATKSDHLTVVAGKRAAFEPAIVLSPAPTKDLSWPQTPLPTLTAELGLLPQCPPPQNALEPRPVSCWRGVVDGQIIDVQSVEERGTTSMGLLIVNVWEGGAYTSTSIQTYTPPQNIGAMRITSVDRLRFTFSPVDPNLHDILVFDLGSHQWASSTALPLPEPSPLPSPSS